MSNKTKINYFENVDETFERAKTCEEACRKGEGIVRQTIDGDYKQLRTDDLIELLKNGLERVLRYDWSPEALVNFDPDGQIPSEGDSQMWVIMFPTYALIAIGVYVMNRFPELLDERNKNGLKIVMDAAFRDRGILGHGYERYSTTLQMLIMFDRAGARAFIEKNPTFSKRFTSVMFETFEMYREVLEEEQMCSEKRDSGKRIWYAAYGSSICRERFSCFVLGGFLLDNHRKYMGCRDKSMWIEGGIRQFPGEVYFGNESSSWEGKAVAFYDPNGNGESYMRLYGITYEQLMDIREQEGHSDNWYGRIHCLGIHEDGNPIYTLTSGQRRPKGAPSDRYVNIIKRALILECGLSAKEAEDYISKRCHQ